MHAILLLASTEDAAHSHSIIDALPHMAGMLMVMFTLAFLWGICALTAKMVSIFLPEKKPEVPTTAKAPPPTTATPATTDSRIAPEIVAVIAAAVATVTRDQPVRIVSIKPMSTSWERAGRQSVLTSHRIR